MTWLNVGWVDPDAYVEQAIDRGWSVIGRKETAILIQTVGATPGDRTGSRGYNLVAQDVSVGGKWLLSVTGSVREAKRAFALYR